MIKLIITINDSEQTLIKFLKKVLKKTPLSLIYKLLRSQVILLNNKKIKDYNIILQLNDEILINDSNLEISHKLDDQNSEMELSIIYEDDNLLIIDKPHNTVVHHPTQDCLDNAVRKYLKDIDFSYSFTVSHIHRLDKLTRGLICYAKNKIASKILLKAIQNHNQIEKTYLAVCQGVVEKKDIIKGYLTYNDDLQKMIFNHKRLDKFSKNVAIVIEPLLTKNNQTLLQIKLLTGRKHQIRAILSYYDLPIIGDMKYGSEKIYDHQIFLFAYQLNFQSLLPPLEYLNGKNFFIKNLKTELENNLGNY